MKKEIMFEKVYQGIINIGMKIVKLGLKLKFRSEFKRGKYKGFENETKINISSR